MSDEKRGCLPALLHLFGSGKSEAASLPYGLRDEFLTPAELSFYRVLRNLVRKRAVVLAKVRLADLFYVARPNENRGAFNRIAQKHVDFLLCEPKTMQPLCAIELDDSSHNRRRRRERDAFVDEAFAVANLPLVHIQARHEYKTADLVAQLKPYLA